MTSPWPTLSAARPRFRTSGKSSFPIWAISRAKPAAHPAVEPPDWERLVGPVTLTRQPQVLFAEEDLERARRQPVLYGRDGLPVLSRDGRLRGWLTRADVLKALTSKLASAEQEIERGAVAAEFAARDPSAAVHVPSTLRIVTRCADFAG